MLYALYKCIDVREIQKGKSMKRKKSTQLLAVALTAAMLAQPVGAQMVFAEGNADAVQQEQEVSPAAETTGAVLKSGTAVIPADADLNQVKEILGKTLVENADQVDLNSLEWEYECKATSGLSSNTAWGSIEGFTSSKKGIFGTTTYTHPSLAANTDGTYKVRLKGTTTEVTLTKTQKLTSAISIKDNTNVNLVYNEDGSINYDAVRQNIFNTVVESTTPKLTVNDVTIEYYATVTTVVGDRKEWMPLEGGTSGTLIPLNYPAMEEGTQKIKISYAGTDTYSGASAEATVNIGIGKEQSEIAFKKNPTIKLVYNDDLTVDYAAVKEAIMNDVIDAKNSRPEGLSLDNLTIEYYATATTGAAMGFGNAWAPIEGGKINGLTYPGIPEGTQKIRVTYAGDKENAAVTAETNITVIDREQSAFNLNEPAEGAASYEVPMAFNEDQTYDYDATAKAIYNAVVASTVPENLTADDVTIRYNAGTDLIKNWQPLNTTDWTSTFTKFGPGEWTIQFSWAGNKEYKGATTEVKVNVTDNRLASAIVCKEGVSFTYNMDAAVMKQAIFDNVIDWENSTLPAKDTLTVDNFTMEYFGSNTLAGDIDGGVKQWAPIEGGTVTLLTYAQMGAGEQKIRITYKGNAQYRPSAQTESTVTVNKAKVKVKVKSTSIYAGATLPEDFVTMNPADKFDVYTVYGGLTSNANLSLYLDLPDKYTNSAVLKLLDPIVEKLYGKTFTQMMNDGMTVGELRQLLSTQELLDLLEKLHIDTGTFGQILTIINKMPSVADSVRVSFGTPNHAGLYTVTAVTDSKNYETGVGIGTLLVKMRSKGVKLNWNERFVNGKITAEKAKNFDFKATLSADGAVTIAQDNVHYLYSGFTSKWKIYSSTTTPPTEPGSYVMTVVTLGGDYQAAPIKRGFKITK
jgi:hypothetical protein